MEITEHCVDQRDAVKQIVLPVLVGDDTERAVVDRARDPTVPADVSRRNLSPIIRLNVPNEHPPAGYNKGFRRSDRSSAISLNSHVLLSSEILLAVREHVSH
jgi:hypothetical protein